MWIKGKSILLNESDTRLINLKTACSIKVEQSLLKEGGYYWRVSYPSFNLYSEKTWETRKEAEKDLLSILHVLNYNGIEPIEIPIKGLV